MTCLWPSSPEPALAWRERFSTAVSPSLSAHISSPMSCGAAGALGSSNSTCPTCSHGEPCAGGLPSPSTSGTAEVSENLDWCCLCTALISFVFSLLSLCHFSPKGEGFILSVLMQQPCVSTFCSLLSYVLSCLMKPSEAHPFPHGCFFSSCASIVALTYLPVTFKWKCPAGRLITAHNIA